MATKKASAVARGAAAVTAAARKVAAGSGSARSTGTAKAPAKKTAKAPVKKVSAKAPAKKATAQKQAPAKKTVATKAPAKGTATKAPAKKASAKRAPVKKSTSTKAPPALVVRADEKPWTGKELVAVRSELEADRDRLQAEIATVERGLQDLLRDGGDGAGNDQADVGSTTLERDAEMSLANNTREMLFQVQRALGRLDDGSYGVCESCGNPIGKLRLMAFPRATLCLTCKQREERR